MTSRNGLNIESSLSVTRKRAIMSGTPYIITKQFPWKLHEMLDLVEKSGDDSIVSWLPGGQAFRVHMPELFVGKVMKLCFNQTKYKSFQRQLNLWGFERNTKECVEKGAYSHPLFLRGRRDLCQEMARQKVKGKGPKKAGIQKSISPNFKSSSPGPILQPSLTNQLPGVVPDTTSTPVLAPSPTISSALEANLLGRFQQARDHSLVEALKSLDRSRNKSSATVQSLLGFDPSMSRALGVEPTLMQAEQEAMLAIRERAAMETILQAMRERERSSTAVFAAALSGASRSPT
jgi:hypothetical protein